MPFKIALAQFKPVRNNVSANIEKIETLLSDIQADLVVLPELSNSGYLYKSPDDLRPYAEPKNGKGLFLSALQKLAGSTDGVIVSGYAEMDNADLYNSACAISPDGVICNYRKIHLYSDEKSLFSPGKNGFKLFNWLGVRVGIMICFDWIFPEAARTLSLSGEQILAHPANLVLPYCQDAMITRSIENRVFTITANRIGKETLDDSELTFTGGSQFTDPNGRVLFRAPKSEETVHTFSIEPEDALDKAISPHNDLFHDRRIDQYELI